jgi:hypothetical protein
MKLHIKKDTKRIVIITIKYKIIKNAYAYILISMLMHDNIIVITYAY